MVCADYLSTILYYEITPLIRDVTCSKLKRYREKICDVKLSAKHTLHVQREGYQEPHEDLQAHPALSYQWDLN